MFFPITAALFMASGYATYIFMVYGGDSQPNPASWGLWAILSALTAATFWQGSKSALAATQFFTGAAACIVVWVYAQFAGKFQPWETMDWVVFALCFVVIAVWWHWKRAAYANIVLGFIGIVAFIPTVEGLHTNTAQEHPFPWILWTAAYLITLVDIVRRRFHEQEGAWWLMLFTPSVDALIHVTIGVFAIL